MLNKSVARRYAEAFFSIATDQGKMDQYQSELEVIIHDIENVENFKDFLAYPLIPAQEKKKIATQLFADRVSSTTMHFVLMIIDKKRETYLELIYDEYLDMANQARNIQKAELVSAREVPEDELKALAATLSKTTGKIIQLSQKIDPRLLGGIKIRVGDRIIDATISKKLEMLKESMKQAKIS